MVRTARRLALVAFGLAVALGSFVLAAEAPTTPEPKVVATIAQPAKAGGACLVIAEIRDPQSNEVLASPKLAVVAGEQASVSSSEADRGLELSVKAAGGCTGGSYTVNVSVNGKLAYAKSGVLTPKQ
jgi:hypothetical protein